MDEQERESAVGKLLREHGVEKGARRSDIHRIGIREAERLTGVSRQTLSVWLKPLTADEGFRRKYDDHTLDLVARGLNISRRELGLAALRDGSRHVLIGNDDETLQRVYEYLAERDPAEQMQILSWLAQRIAERSGERTESTVQRTETPTARDDEPSGAA